MQEIKRKEFKFNFYFFVNMPMPYPLHHSFLPCPLVGRLVFVGLDPLVDVTLLPPESVGPAHYVPVDHLVEETA